MTTDGTGAGTQPGFHIAEATVVVPSAGSLDGQARRIVQAVRIHRGVELAVVSGDGALAGLSTRHAIALGCLADNAFVAALYGNWQTLVDRWYPGVGGSVLQLIPSAQRQGDHVLLLGGSDLPGVSAATTRFLEQLAAADGGTVSWQLHVRLGDDHLPLPADRMDCLGTAASPILTPESALPESPYESGFVTGTARNHLLRLGMYGPHADNFHLSRSSQFGLRYLYTGRLEDAQDYRRALLAEARRGVLQRLYHYKSIRMFQLWAVLGDCPVFAAHERLEISGAMRCYLLTESGIASKQMIQAASGGTQIFSRHIACDALNLWIGADWLWRETGEDRWLDERAVADAYFEAQAGTDVPLTGLTEGYASYLDVYLEWMVLRHPGAIAKDPHIRLWAERVAGLCTNTGQLVLGPQTDPSRYPYHLLRKLACLLKDGRYLHVADLRERQVARGMDRILQFTAGQAWAADVEAVEPDDAVGLTVYPMNERLRQWQAPTIRAGKGFDRAVGRSGWAAADEYLMVIGVRSGGKSLPNVGTLAAYERFGQRLITADLVPLYPRSASPWRHSRATVSIGGLGAGMSEGAEVLVQRAVAGGHLFSFAISADGHHRWFRSLYWKPSAYVLIVDHILVQGEATWPWSLGVNWRCAGRVLGIEDDLATLAISIAEVAGRFHVQVAGGLRLHAETDSYPALGAPAGTPATTELMLHGLLNLPAGRPDVEVATLLHAVAGTDGTEYRLASRDGGWKLTGTDEVCEFDTGEAAGEMAIRVSVGRQMPDRAPATPSGPSVHAGPRALSGRWAFDLPPSASITAWTQTADGSALAVGTDDGDVVVVDADGKAQWKTRCATAITALTVTDQDLVVGTRAGDVHRFDPAGAEQWRYSCPFREERAFWPWWFLSTPAIGALAAGCDPASGQQIVAVGTGSTNIIFLDGNAGLLLDDVVSPYGWPDRLQAHQSAAGDLEFLVGHTWLSCGSTVRGWVLSPQARENVAYRRSVDAMGRSTDGWDSCGVVDFRVGPLTPGGPGRMVVLRHGAVHQLTMYDEASGDPLWDAGIGGAPVALGVMAGPESEAAARLYVADQFGGLVTFDATGRRLAAIRVAPALRGMSITGHGGLALWNTEQLYTIDAEGGEDRYRFTGVPIGWYVHAENSGLLCAQQNRLVLHR